MVKKNGGSEYSAKFNDGVDDEIVTVTLIHHTMCLLKMLFAHAISTNNA